MLTDTEIVELAVTIERLLIEYDLHLSADQFIALHDHIADLVRRIYEGE